MKEYTFTPFEEVFTDNMNKFFATDGSRNLAYEFAKMNYQIELELYDVIKHLDQPEEKNKYYHIYIK